MSQRVGVARAAGFVERDGSGRRDRGLRRAPAGEGFPEGVGVAALEECALRGARRSGHIGQLADELATVVRDAVQGPERDGRSPELLDLGRLGFVARSPELAREGIASRDELARVHDEQIGSRARHRDILPPAAVREPRLPTVRRAHQATTAPPGRDQWAAALRRATASMVTAVRSTSAVTTYFAAAL